MINKKGKAVASEDVAAFPGSQVFVLLLFPVFDTLGQKIFNLSVDGAEVILCPLGQFIPEAG